MGVIITSRSIIAEDVDDKLQNTIEKIITNQDSQMEDLLGSF